MVSCALIQVGQVDGCSATKRVQLVSAIVGVYIVMKVVVTGCVGRHDRTSQRRNTLQSQWFKCLRPHHSHCTPESGGHLSQEEGSRDKMAAKSNLRLRFIPATTKPKPLLLHIMNKWYRKLWAWLPEVGAQRDLFAWVCVEANAETTRRKTKHRHIIINCPLAFRRAVLTGKWTVGLVRLVWLWARRSVVSCRLWGPWTRVHVLTASHCSLSHNTGLRTENIMNILSGQCTGNTGRISAKWVHLFIGERRSPLMNLWINEQRLITNRFF